MLLFDLPMRGSWLALLAAVSLFLVGALAFGLLISTMAETQQVAFQVALLTSYLPTLMLSGFIFPISSMPAFLQIVTYAVPARYFLIALRGIVLKGVGLGDVLAGARCARRLCGRHSGAGVVAACGGSGHDIDGAGSVGRIVAQSWAGCSTSSARSFSSCGRIRGCSAW